ncbi:MAG: glycosyltransferase, partial [Planctomycetota bacterium]
RLLPLGVLARGPPGGVMSGRPFRLAYLSSDPGIAPDGDKGAAVHFREMALALGRAGADLDVFMARGGEASRFGSGVRIIEAGRDRGPAGELLTLAGSRAMLEALAGSSPHDAVYERLSLFGAAGLAHARREGIPFLLEVNAPLWEEARRYRSLHLGQTARALALDVMAGADHLLVVSKELSKILVAEGVDRGKIHVMSNGVNQDLFDAAAPARRPDALEGKPALVFIGSLKPWHGIDFLLEAFLRLRRQTALGLWVVGDGPLGGEVARAAAEHPDDIVFDRQVPHEKIPGILKAADAALAPYPSTAPAYFCPLKVVEALAAGCPIVASRTTSVTDLAGESPLLELHEPEDSEDFGRAVTRVLQRERGAPRSDHSWQSKARRVLELAGRVDCPEEPARRLP